MKQKRLKILLMILLVSLFGSLGIFFNSQKGIEASTTPVQPPQPARTIGWNETISSDINDHFFLTKDDFKTLSDAAGFKLNGSDFINMVWFTYIKPVSYWDFFSYNDLMNAPNANDDKEATITYFNDKSKKTYSLYSIKLENGSSISPPYYLIVNRTDKRAIGIFRNNSGISPECRQGGTNILCPYTYYQAENSFNSDWNWGAASLYYKGKYLELRYTLQVANQSSFLARYIQSVNLANNRQGLRVSTSVVGGDCPAGSLLTAEEYKKCYWPSGETFNGTIHAGDGSAAPTITIPESGDSSALNRQPFTFTLNYVLRTRGISEREGNWFYYVSTSPSHPNLALRLKDCEDSGPIITYDPKNANSWNTSTVQEVGAYVKIPNRDKLYEAVIRKVYNDDSVSPTKTIKPPESASFGTDYCPDSRDINVTDGWLKKWGVDSEESAESSKDEDSAEDSACEKSCPSGASIGSLFKNMLCRLGCLFFEIAGKFIEWSLDALKKAAGISQNLFIEKTFAAGEKSLSLQIRDEPRIANAWKFSLMIVDVVVIFALLIIAFANILKLNIDIYAVKKSLPKLLIGIILANLSLLIARVIIDIASLLSQYFLDKAGGAENVNQSLAALMFNANAAVTGEIAATAIAASLAGLFAGPLWFFATPLVLIFLMIPGFLIFALAFLLYARIYVVWILVILAPITFICLGFPPAEQYFKTWWSWFTKWVFMAPIVFFFIALASRLGAVALQGIEAPNVPGGKAISGIGGWVLGMVVLGMALYVPQKIGGAIMAGWSALGQKMAGINKGGYLRSAAGLAARGVGTSLLVDNEGNTNWLGKLVGKAKTISESIKAGQEARLESVFGEAKQNQIRSILQKKRAGVPLNPGEKATLRAWQDKIRKEGEDYTHENLDTLISYLGNNPEEIKQTMDAWKNSTLPGDEFNRVNAIIYGLKNNRNLAGLNHDERLKKQQEITEKLGQNIFQEEDIPVGGETEGRGKQEIDVTQRPGEQEAVVAQLARIQNTLERYLQIGNNKNNFQTHITQLERLNNHLVGGGGWGDAPAELKERFLEMRPEIRPQIEKGTVDKAELIREVQDTLDTATAMRELNLPENLEVPDRTQKVVERVNVIRTQKLNIENAHSDLSSKLQNLSANISREQLPTELPTQVQNIELPQEQIINAVHAVRVRQNLTQKVTNEQILNTVRQNIKRTFETEPGQPPLTTEQIQSIIEEFRSDPNRFREIIETSAQQLEK